MEFCHCILRNKLFLHSACIEECYIFHSCKIFIVLFHRFVVCAPFWEETKFLTLDRERCPNTGSCNNLLISEHKDQKA